MRQRLTTNERCLKILEFDIIIEKWANYAGTKQGRERVLSSFPTFIEEDVIQELDTTEEAIKVLEFHPDYHFGGIYDLRDIIKRANIGSILNSEEFLYILSTVEATGRHQDFFASFEPEIPILKSLGFSLLDLIEIKNQFGQMLSNRGELLDDASPELSRIRRDIRSAQVGIRSKLDLILKASEYQKFFQESLYSVRNNRYVIPVKQEYRLQFPGIVHDQSASGHTVFIEPMALVDINNDLAQLHSAEKNEIERLLRLLTSIVAKNGQSLLANSETLTELDYIFSKGKFSKSLNGCRPKLIETTKINLKNARHPLLDPNSVVPITIEIGDACKALVITGPNTGGKTVALKTVGLLVAMHQCGLFIPTSEASEIPIFTGIFSDIGDEQSLEQNLSTFSGHMKQIIEILAKLTKKRDLILLDELGAGTDPEEGTALAIALLDKLMLENGKVLLTSHYGELKAHAFSHPEMENASMEFDLESLRPTYRLILGIPGESNALAISKRLGLPDDIVQNAAKKVRSETRELNELLTNLRQQHESLKAQFAQVEQDRQRIITEKERFESDKDKWLETQEKEVEKIRAKGQKFLADGRKEMDSILESLKEFRHGKLIGADLERNLQKERNRINKLQDELSGVKVELDSSFNEQTDSFTPGDGVYITSLKSSGTVISIEGNQLWVEIGSLKMKMPMIGLKKLAAAPKAEPKKDSGRRRITKINEKARKEMTAKAIGIEVDVRGHNAEEAILKVERFIDESLMAGTPFIRIIHGKGTGVLKTKIHEMLRGYPGIKGFNFAPYNQGGDGATEVQL